MISWIVIVILLVVGVFAVKMNHLRHRIFIIIIVVFALFLYTSMAYINTQNNLDFTTTEGLASSLKIYTGWLANGFQNLKVVTGNTVKMDWTSTNGSFLNKTKTDSKTSLNKK